MKARTVGRSVFCLQSLRNPLRRRQTALPREGQVRSWPDPPNWGWRRDLTGRRTPRARIPARLVRPSSECSHPGVRWHGPKIPSEVGTNRAAGFRRHAPSAPAGRPARGTPPTHVALAAPVTGNRTEMVRSLEASCGTPCPTRGQKTSRACRSAAVGGYLRSREPGRPPRGRALAGNAPAGVEWRQVHSRIVIGRAAPPTTRSQPLITDDHDLVNFGTRRNTDLGPDRPIPLPVPLKHVGSWQQRHGGSVDPPERANPAN